MSRRGPEGERTFAPTKAGGRLPRPSFSPEIRMALQDPDRQMGPFVEVQPGETFDPGHTTEIEGKTYVMARAAIEARKQKAVTSQDDGVQLSPKVSPRLVPA